MFTMLMAPALSAVVNKTPIVVGVTLRAKASPSSVLMWASYLYVIPQFFPF